MPPFLPLLRLLLLVAGVALPTLTSAVGTDLLGTSEADPATVIGPLATPEDVDDAVARLSDAQVRAVLLDRMDAVARDDNTAAEAVRMSLVDLTNRTVDGLQRNISTAVVELPAMFRWQAHAFNVFSSTRQWQGIARFLGVIALAVVIGLLAERVVAAIVRRWRSTIEFEERPAGLFAAVRKLALRLAFDLIALIAFFYITRLVATSLAMPQDAALTRLFMIDFVVLPRLVAAAARFVLAPNHAEFRLINTDDQTAVRMSRHAITWVVLIGFSDFVLQFNQINGVPFDASHVVFWLNLMTYAYLGWAVWQTRNALPAMLLGRDGDNTAAERWVAQHYATLALALVPLSWLLVEVLNINRQFQLVQDGGVLVFVALLMSAPLFDTAVRGTVKALIGEFSGEGKIAEQAFRSTRRSMIRIGRVLLFALFLIITVPLFELDMDTMSGSGLIGELINRLIDVLFHIAVGYLVWELVTLAFNRRLAAEQTASTQSDEDNFGGEGGGAGVSRLATVLPLARWTLQALIISTTVLIALSEMEVDITPLLAGAGVVGLAVGFGAQKLVADVVSGIFFLIDDAFRAGEYVDIEGTVGTVESISLRSMQLRHHRGAIHTIPYGEIPRITNYSRDWVIMKLRFTVPFETNLNTVKKIFKQIGRDMLEIPELADDFIQPFKSQGALEVDDVGIVVRGKFMAKPGKQFTLRKEILARVQRAFDENGIQFARKEVRVRIDGDDTSGNTELPAPTPGPST